VVCYWHLTDYAFYRYLNYYESNVQSFSVSKRNGFTIRCVKNYSTPIAVTIAPTEVASTSATLHGTIYPNGDNTIVSFEYGSTIGYSDSVVAIQSPVTGTDTIAVNANITGLTPNTAYHFRVKAETQEVLPMVIL